MYEQAPPEVIRSLREIDPVADLRKMGDGRWALGSWPSPFTTHHMAEAREILYMLMEDRAIWPTPMRTELKRWYLFVREGFRPIHDFSQDTDFGEILAWFKRQEWLYRTGALGRMKRPEALHPWRKAIKEYAELEGMKDLRFVRRGRRPGVVNLWQGATA